MCIYVYLFICMCAWMVENNATGFKKNLLMWIFTCWHNDRASSCSPFDKYGNLLKGFRIVACVVLVRLRRLAYWSCSSGFVLTHANPLASTVEPPIGRVFAWNYIDISPGLCFANRGFYFLLDSWVWQLLLVGLIPLTSVEVKKPEMWAMWQENFTSGTGKLTDVGCLR